MTLRLLWLSDKLTGYSAYSKVSKEFCTRTAKLGHKVAHIPMMKVNRMGKYSDEGVLVYESGRDQFAEDVAIDDYVDWKADMLIALKETWVFNRIFKYAFNFVPYCPVDHEPVSPALTSRMRTAFRVLTPSKFGVRELEFADVENVRYMPHGVNTSVYKPLEDKAECRKYFFLEEGDFVVLYVGWNRVRKMIPRMLRGYRRFLDWNPDVRAHFLLWTDVVAPHMSAEAPAGVADVGVNLTPLMKELDLLTGPNDARWPEWKEIRKIGGLPEWDPKGGWDMVKLYNSADVVNGCTGGEGFWEVGLESQASGIPVVVTDYAAAPEIVGYGAGLTVPWYDYDILVTPGTKFALPDIDKIAEALTKIMNGDPEKMARQARNQALKYDWSKIIEQYWEPFLAECESELKPLITKAGIKTWA